MRRNNEVFSLKIAKENVLFGGEAINKDIYYIGIDIGSTAAKVSLIKDDKINHTVLPTGWCSKETAGIIRENIEDKYKINLASDMARVVATGYGRISVEYADFEITEITCHARGGRELSKSENTTIIDVGGQDTKVISLENGYVSDFLMNDKCSAGTGRFIEIMANKLNLTLEELFDLASKGDAIEISSMCTVFAESEVISYIGQGRNKEDIAAGVVDSVAKKVAQLAGRAKVKDDVILTGGLSNVPYFAKVLEDKLQSPVHTTVDGKFAGSFGAALLAKEKKKR